MKHQALRLRTFARKSHKHSALISACFVIFLGVAFVVMKQVSADAGWTQTDWSGGAGSSTTNQYSSASSVDPTGTPGQVTLAIGANKFSNSSFDSSTDTDSWLGTDPTSIAGLKFYVKVDSGVYSDSGSTPAADGQDVQQWNDLSGNGQNATAPSSARRPTLHSNQINGRAALTFTQASDSANNDDALNATLSSILSLSDATFFTVGSFDYANQPAGNYDYLYSVYDSSNPAATALGSIARGASDSGFADREYTYYNAGAAMGPSLTSGFKIFTQQFSNTAPRNFLWLNRAAQTVDSVSPESTISNPKVTLGKWQNGTWALNGRLAEFLLFNTALNASDRHTVENYLNNKYNLGTNSLTIDTSIKHSGAGSAKVVTGSDTSELLQNLNVGDTNQHQLVAYAYVDGSTPVDSSYMQLYANGSTVSTNYTSVGGGWYKLTGLVTGVNASRSYGIQIKANKTVYVDDMNMFDYATSGVVTSAIFDGGVQNNWGNLSYNATTPAGTSVSIKVRSGNQPDLSDASGWESCSAIGNSSDVTSACAPDKTRYAQYQVTLTGNGISTPTLQDSTIGYSASDTVAPPTNASSILAYKSNGGDSIGSNGWNNTNPYLSWTAGADDGSGSGIKGYCLYLGTDNTADPVTTKGLLGSSPLDTGGTCQFAVSSTSIDLSTSGYLGTALTTSNTPYYLIIKAIDNANNVYSGSGAAFHFRYDNTSPANPSFVTAPSQFVSSKAVSLTWPTSGGDAASDANSGLAGLQYRIGSSGTWYGDSHSGSGDISDLLSNDGSYTTQSSPDYANLVEGNNIVYFRTWDAAGNVSPAYVTTVIKLNTSSPSSPQNITPAPSTNTTNSFAFSWLAPATYTGSVSNITYCYTINALPNSSNCTYTAAGVTSLPSGAYATQPGDNTLYVVAKDEAGNINYATADSTTFTANTAAPGVPLNPDVADISVKSTNNWKLALSWEEPAQTGAGVASYKVYRSTDGSSFSQVASTSGTSYVDGGLTQQTYYYKVKACDSANNCGTFTSSVHDLPTGKFTSPATLLTGPTVSNITTKKASVAWVTDRGSDSKVAFGTKSGSYSSDEIANSDQAVNHGINLVNLSPGTTYYYIVKWTDEDGNTGTSAEDSFTTLPAPSIKDVTVTGVNISTATITFTSSRADTVKLYYGKSDSFGALKTVNTSESSSTYSIPLSGLDDGTKYYFKLNTIDGDGNEYDSPQANSFTTPSRPRITNLRFQPVPDQPTSTQQITWSTNVPSTSELAYGPNGQAQQNAADPKLATDHSITINGLNDNTEYSLTAQSRDSAGNLAVSDKQVFHTALDTRPPKITNLKVTSSIKGTGTDAAGQIIVSWKTDEPATSQVAYGEGSDNTAYNTSTAEDGALVTDHAVVVSNLSTSQIFHLEALSKDAARNQAHSDNRTTIIGNATDSVISIIFNALQKVFGGF
jgi:hypothetical protein